MSRRFTLAPVLRMRELAADREAQALLRILEQLAELRRALDAVDAEVRRLQQAREQALSGAMPAAHLLDTYRSIEGLRRDRLQLEQRLQTVEASRVRQASLCVAASQAKEVLLTLQRDQQAHWQAAAARAEQKQADDAFLSRFAQRAAEASRQGRGPL